MSHSELVAQQVEIEGFRGIRKGRLELSPLTILVGLNGSGKTAVLEALYLCGQHRRGPLRIDDLDPGGRCPIRYVLQRHAYYGAERQAPDGELRLRLESAGGPGEEKGTILAELELRWPRWLVYAGMERALIRIRSQTDQPLEDWDRVRQAVLLDPFTGPELEQALWFPESSSLMQTPPILAGGRDEWVVKQLREVYPDLPLQRLSGGRGGGERQQTVWAVLGDSPVAIEQLGDGIQSAFRALSLLSLLPAGLFLWDEPEDHQHPDALSGLMRVLIQVLRERPMLQAVIATQSREVLGSILEATLHREELRRWAENACSVAFLMLDLRDGTLYAERISFEELRLMESVDVDIRKLWRGRRIREPREIPRELLEQLLASPGGSRPSS